VRGAAGPEPVVVQARRAAGLHRRPARVHQEPLAESEGAGENKFASMSWLNKTHVGDCRELLGRMAADGVRVQTCVTSPPYFGLRDYGNAAQIGLEASPSAYVSELVAVFRLVRELLSDDGTLWLNLGDSYAGSWGAQGRQGKSGQMANRSVISARQIDAHPKRQSKTGSVAHLEGIKAKDLMGIPWRVAFALQADGWYLRSDIIWHKPNPMPESVTDRPTKAHEYLFLLAKSELYYFDAEAIKESNAEPTGSGGWQSKQRKILRAGAPANYQVNQARRKRTEERNDGDIDERYIYGEGRNRRSVWTIATTPFSGAHFATFPRALIEPCIIAGCPAGGTVLDPFMGSGTTGQVATDLGRNFIGCELNPKYVELHELRRTTVGMAI
jgi:DNA modification methylase